MPWTQDVITAIEQEFPDSDPVAELDPPDGCEGVLVRDIEPIDGDTSPQKARKIRETLEDRNLRPDHTDVVNDRRMIRVRRRIHQPGDNAPNANQDAPNNAREEHPEFHPNIILHGPPGTGKTWAAKHLAKIFKEATGAVDVVGKLNLLSSSGDPDPLDQAQTKLVQFHPSLTYDDFVRGIVAEADNDKIVYKPVHKTFSKLCHDAAQKNNEQKTFVLIIDEINRANLPAVFGELIYALEYRGEPVTTPYEVEKEATLTVPKNLIIIGTMNTADRSIGQMDYAIRRRFHFFPLLPDLSKVTNVAAKTTFNNVLKLFLKDLTAPIDWSSAKRAETLSPDFHPSDVAIGHTYFLKEDWQEQFKHQALPMLVEYLKDGVLLAEQEIAASMVDPKPKCGEIEQVFYNGMTKPANEVVQDFNKRFGE